MIGLPCCWISRMPPGILRSAISLRMVSPSCFSAPGASVAAAGVADSAWSSNAQPAARASASAAAARRRRAAFLVCQRFINQQLEGALDALTFRGRLLQQYKHHLLLAVDHHVAAAGAVPFQFAERARRRRFCVAGIGAHGKSEPHAKPIAGEIEVVALDARALTDIV